MRRLAVGVLMLVSSLSASADWIRIADSMDGKVHHYLDPATIRRSGAWMQVVSLTDYDEPQVISDTQRFHSVKMQDAFDCAGRRGQHLTLTALAGNMGSGPVVATELRPAGVRKVSPDTPDEDMWKFVCARQ